MLICPFLEVLPFHCWNHLPSSSSEKAHMIINKEVENHGKARLQIFSLQSGIKEKKLGERKKEKFLWFEFSDSSFKLSLNSLRYIFNHLLFWRDGIIYILSHNFMSISIFGMHKLSEILNYLIWHLITSL